MSSSTVARSTRPAGLPVAIAGLGPVSSLGVGLPAFTAGLGRPETLGVGAAFRGVDGFDVRAHVNLKTQCLDIASGMTVAATAMAMADAGWREKPGDPTRTGMVLGTAYGNGAVLRDYTGSSKVSPLRFVHTFINTPAGLACQALALRGPHALLCSGHLSGLQAIRYACHLLASGKADRILCGGVDSLRFCGAESGLARRTGLPRGEGAGILALQRGLDGPGRTYATVAGLGSASAREVGPDLFAGALRGALDAAGLATSDLDGVVLATSELDRCGGMERAALLEAGVAPDRWLDLASLTGEVGAAHGGLALVAASLRVAAGRGARVAAMGVDRGTCLAVLLEGVSHVRA